MPIQLENTVVQCGVEAAFVKARSATYPKHTHEEYVISANLWGTEEIWLNGERRLVPLGSVTVYNPYTIQASTFDDKGATFISLHLDQRVVERCCAVSGLGSAKQPLLREGVLQDRQVFKGITDYARSLWRGAQVTEDDLVALLTLLVADPALAEVRECSEKIKRAKDFIESESHSGSSLAGLSAMVGMSKYHFSRCFHAQVGMSPIQYQMQLKLIRARRLLRQGCHPIDVAHELGFYDQSHFINAFKKVMGISPHHYAKALSDQESGIFSTNSW